MQIPMLHTAVPRQPLARNAVMLALGGYLGLLILSGSINNYMNVQFQWLVALAAGLFLLIGAFNLWQLWTARSQQHAHHDPHDHDDHHHAEVPWSAVLMVALPLAFALLVPSRPLGASAVQGINFNSVGVGNAISASQAPLDRNLIDWLREFNRVNNAASFNGQPADLIGFVYREPFMTADQFMLMRFTISCCVADASAIGVPVQVANAAAYQDGAWVAVKGQFQAGTFHDTIMPILIPATVTLTDVPARPYLYP